MSVRERKTHSPNHERWLVSYADFITLLFALFVVLFAASNADRTKARQVARAVESAIEHSGVRTPKEVPQAGQQSQLSLDATYGALVESLSTEIQNHQVRMSLEQRGLVITLNQRAFFRSGDADYDPAMYPTLGKIAAAIGRVDNPIRMEGHTDSIPIHNDRFRSNWELSAARSIAVLDLLANRFAIPSGRLAIAGYADTAPVSGNDTEEGRARNRRVDIVVLRQDEIRKEAR